MAGRIFTNLFGSRRKKIIALVLLGSSAVTLAVALPVTLTLSPPKSSTVETPTAQNEPPNPGIDGGVGVPPVQEPGPVLPPVVKDPPKSADRKLLLVAAGQSNMQGVILQNQGMRNSYKFSSKTPVIYTAASGGYANNESTWMKNEPVQLKSEGDGVNGFSIAKAIAFKLAETAVYSKIWMVNTSIGGTAFHVEPPINLMPLGRAYQPDMVVQGIQKTPDLQKEMLDGNVDVRMVWLQGESDTKYIDSVEKQNNFTNVTAGYLSTIRDRLPLPANSVVPIVVGGMQPEWVNGKGTGHPVFNRKLTQQALKDIPSFLPYSSYADPSGAPKNSREADDVHYGLTQLGFMADKYISSFAPALANKRPVKAKVLRTVNRVFAQFGKLSEDEKTTDKGVWREKFAADSFLNAIYWNDVNEVNSAKEAADANFSRLIESYRFQTAESYSNPKKRYRFRINFGSESSGGQGVSVVFTQSVNPTFYNGNVFSSADAFQIEEVSVSQRSSPVGKNGQAWAPVPGFTSVNIDVSYFRTTASGVSNNVWSPDPRPSVFTMSSGKTQIVLPVAGTNKTSLLGTISSKDGSMSWDFDQLTIEMLAETTE